MGLDIKRIKEKWKAKDVQAKAMEGDLREGRPPEIGSPCQRCGDWTEEITCVYADYWLCPRCASFHNGIRRRFGVDRQNTSLTVEQPACLRAGWVPSDPEHGDGLAGGSVVPNDKSRTYSAADAAEAPQRAGDVRPATVDDHYAHVRLTGRG